VVEPGAASATPAGTAVKAPGAGPNATVTVGDTRGLVNQSVTVSWTGFTPSSATVLNNGGGTYDENTQNPVRVYQCRGANPSSSSDCYGSPGFSGLRDSSGNYTTDPVPGYTYPGQTDPSENSPDGPANFEDTVTGPSGRGQVNIEIFTTVESPTLGCSPSRQCSIVVVPNYGNGGFQSATEQDLDAPWAWSDRTVVPLTFAPEGQTCSLSASPLTVEGSPVDARLMASWQVGACHARTGGVDVNYTANPEPVSRTDFAAGSTDIGLTTLPLTAQPASRPVYAPIALSSIVIGFQVDDADGQPVTHMKLDARLVAKLITASYHAADDPNISSHAAYNIFSDPEFLRLNPGVKWPDGTPGNHPILLADQSDLTYELTRWINSDKQARAFLDGKPDPWGMTVNAAYKGIKLPVSTFPSLDANQSTNFQPIQGLAQTAQQLSIAQFPGGFLDTTSSPPVVDKFPRQNPGSREVIGIVDAADANDFLLHTAALQNAAGRYVVPNAANVLAAAQHMSAGANGITRQVNLGNTDPTAYPLAVESDAIVPTRAPRAERDEIAHFLAYANGAGQTPGTALGQLPAGYVPLPSSLQAQSRHAIAAVVRGDRTGTASGPGVGKTNRSGGRHGGAPATPPSGRAGASAPSVTIPPSTSTQAGTSPLGSSPVVAPANAVLDAVKSLASGRTTMLWLLVFGALTFLAGPAVIWGLRPNVLLARVPIGRLANWRARWRR
jgi:hypothetical protein